MAAVVAPAVKRATSDREASTCQRNMRQLGMALSLYMADNAGHFPTNKLSPTNPRSSFRVFLPTTPRAPNYSQLPFVAGLDPYVKRGVPAEHFSTAKSPTETVWRCPSVVDNYGPSVTGSVPGFGDSRITYAINFHVLQKTLSQIPEPVKTPVLWEMGVADQSVALAWTTETLYPPQNKPNNIFHTNPHSTQRSRAETNLHSGASHFLMADGSVKSVADSVADDDNVSTTAAYGSARWALLNDAGDVLMWITP